MNEQKNEENGTLIIHFEALGSAMFTPEFIGMIVPTQLLAVAEFLKFQALAALEDQRTIARSQIVRPQIEVPKGLMK